MYFLKASTSTFTLNGVTFDTKDVYLSNQVVYFVHQSNREMSNSVTFYIVPFVMAKKTCSFIYVTSYDYRHVPADCCTDYVIMIV